MGKVLSRKFFNRDTKVVAQDLIGKFLIRKIGNKKISVMILETEAYDGFYDKASHAFIGKTKRNEVMFERAGIFYVYLTYGMHFMLNIVTREKDYPAAVLIRGAKVENSEVLLNGPAKLTKFLKIEKSFNNKKAEVSNGLWFEDGGVDINKNNIKKTPRIGVNYTGPFWANKKLRFILEG